MAMNDLKVKVRAGNTAANDGFTGKDGEFTANTQKHTLVVHDNATTGGHELAKANLDNIHDKIPSTSLGAHDNNTGNANIHDDDKILVIDDSDSNKVKSIRRGDLLSGLVTSGNTGVTGVTARTGGGLTATGTSSVSLEIEDGTAATQIMLWDGNNWDPANHELNTLKDVTISNPASGHILIHDGTDWDNRAIAPGDLGSGAGANKVLKSGSSSTMSFESLAVADLPNSISSNTTVTSRFSSGSLTVPTLTVDTKGRVTAISAQSLTIPDTNTQRDDSEIRGLFSGTRGITYNSSSGQIQGPDLSTYATTSSLSSYAALTGATFTGDVSLNGNTTDLTVGGNATIQGNLTVQGDTTTLNVTTLAVEDANIELQVNYKSGGAQQNATAPNTTPGLTIYRGSETDVTWQWTESDNKWQLHDGTALRDVLHSGSTGAIGAALLASAVQNRLAPVSGTGILRVNTAGTATLGSIGNADITDNTITTAKVASNFFNGYATTTQLGTKQDSLGATQIPPTTGTGLLKRASGANISLGLLVNADITDGTIESGKLNANVTGRLLPDASSASDNQIATVSSGAWTISNAPSSNDPRLPSSLTGQAGKGLKVNPGANAFVFEDFPTAGNAKVKWGTAETLTIPNTVTGEDKLRGTSFNFEADGLYQFAFKESSTSDKILYSYVIEGQEIIDNSTEATSGAATTSTNSYQIMSFAKDDGSVITVRVGRASGNELLLDAEMFTLSGTHTRAESNVVVREWIVTDAVVLGGGGGGSGSGLFSLTDADIGVANNVHDDDKLPIIDDSENADADKPKYLTIAEGKKVFNPRSELGVPQVLLPSGGTNPFSTIATPGSTAVTTGATININHMYLINYAESETGTDFGPGFMFSGRHLHSLQRIASASEAASGGNRRIRVDAEFSGVGDIEFYMHTDNTLWVQSDNTANLYLRIEEIPLNSMGPTVLLPSSGSNPFETLTTTGAPPVATNATIDANKLYLIQYAASETGEDYGPGLTISGAQLHSLTRLTTGSEATTYSSGTNKYVRMGAPRQATGAYIDFYLNQAHQVWVASNQGTVTIRIEEL